MEARKRFMSIDLTKLPDPPMPSYMFTFFSRDLFEKSKFKDYDSLLESKVYRSQARVSHLASILGNGNSIGTNGNLMRPHIKHESKTADVKVPETTSTYYVNGGCYNQADPIYVAPNSGTYEKLDCVAKSESCFTSNLIRCDQRTRECIYDVTYADKRRTKGWIAGDVITFVLDQNQERILFGCGRDQTSGDGSFGPEYAGIAGLGRRVLTSGYSLPSQFEADIMSMCLPGLHSESATISFHTTPFDNSISAELLPNPAYPNFYFVNLYKVFINEREIPLNPSIDIDSGCLVVLEQLLPISLEIFIMYFVTHSEKKYKT
ncbi:hypothetical protein BC332_17862 [Capsicum chinense]|nr:hypothetical protein BC332_17862 [Capsicum chinense]